MIGSPANLKKGSMASHTKPMAAMGVSRAARGMCLMRTGPNQAPAISRRPTTKLDATAPFQILSTTSLASPGPSGMRSKLRAIMYSTVSGRTTEKVMRMPAGALTP